MPDGSRLDEVYGRFPFPVERCPHRVIRESGEELHDVFRLVRDHDAGVLADWPDGYTGAASGAVYYALEHRDDARANAAGME